MYVNLIGIFLFATLFHGSLQYRCYDCKSSFDVNTVPDALKQKTLALPNSICPDPLTDEVTKDCPQNCGLMDYTIGSTRLVFRSCAENIDCVSNGNIVSSVNGTWTYCGECDKDKCNSAVSTLASASLLGICFSFLSFRIMFS